MGAYKVLRCRSCRYPVAQLKRGLCVACAPVLFGAVRAPAGVPIL